MASGGVIDVSTGIAQTIGRYFSVISVIPSSLYVAFLYILIKSGSWQHAPKWSYAFSSLEKLGIGGIAFLALISIALGVAIHPIQFSIVQFFEGYWGNTRIAQAVRSQRILHYQRLCEELTEERVRVRKQLLQLSHADVKIPAVRTPLLSPLPLTSGTYDRLREI